MPHVSVRLSSLAALVALVSCSVACSSAVGSPVTADDAGGATNAGGQPPGGADDDAGIGASSGSGGSGSPSGSSSSGSGSSSSGGSSSGGSSSGGSSSGGSSSGGSSSGGSSSGATGDAGTSSSGGTGSSSGGATWTPPSAQPIHFHWQLSDTFTTADLLANQQGLAVYDIDGENATKADVDAIHAAGAKAVCYVDVGTLETGRSDFAQFPASVVGPGVQGWPGENWFLVTAANQSILLPLMKARFQNWCVAKGFDAIEPDNLDAFSNIKGVTEADNVAYDLAIASLAHGMSLSIGLKNLLSDVTAAEVTKLVATFDWALVEQCYEFTECDVYTQAGSFIATGKAVWDVEYNKAPTCTAADQGHLNAQLRDLDLQAPTNSKYTYTPCVPDSQATW